MSRYRVNETVLGVQSLRRCDPFSPPRWRWDLAGEIVRDRHVDRREVDSMVEAAANLRAELEGSKCSERIVVRKPSASLMKAQELHQEDGPRRWELEARLVAGQSDAEIAENCGMAPEVVAAYAKVFCDIRDCLGAHDYLLVHLVGPGVDFGFKDQDVGRFWAWIAMGGGPLVVDTFVATFHAARRFEQPPVLGVYLQPDADVPRKIQAVVAEAVLPMTEQAGKVFRESQLLVMEAEAAVDTNRAKFLLEKAHNWTIRCARAYLAGKPIPRPRRRRTPLAPKHQKTRSASSRGKPLAFEMWEDLITAVHARSRTQDRRGT